MNSHRNITLVSLTLAALSALSTSASVALANSQATDGNQRFISLKPFIHILPGAPKDEMFSLNKSSITNSASIKLPTVPPSPAPPGGRTGEGGALNGNSCPQKQQELTVLTPENVHGFTLSAQPTFWFYVPYTSEELQVGEFSILTWDEEEQIYATSFTLPETPGFVSISLPTSGEVNLEEGQPYHWYVNVYCTAGVGADADLRLDGWVQPLARTPEREQQVSNATTDIWYDSVDHLAGKLQSQSADSLASRQAWTDLLESVGLGDLSQAPFVGPVNVVEMP